MNNELQVDCLDSDLSLAILQEELKIEKRSNVTGVLRLDKTVRNLDALVDENLTSDVISIERVPVNRYLDQPVATRLEGDTTVFPVMEERVIVTKQLVLKEEIRITRHRQQERYREAVPVRVEQVQVTRRDPREPGASSSK